MKTEDIFEALAADLERRADIAAEKATCPDAGRILDDIARAVRVALEACRIDALSRATVTKP